MLRKQKASQLFAKVFHHVCAFKLPMYQHIEAHLFLDANGPRNLLAQEVFIGGLLHLPTFIRGTCRAYLACLWERSDRGRWQDVKLELVLLELFALCKRHLAMGILFP